MSLWISTVILLFKLPISQEYESRTHVMRITFMWFGVFQWFAVWKTAVKQYVKLPPEV